MIIGVPREIKNQEYRVGMVPGGVRTLVRAGHRLLVETKAGDDAGYPDGEYEAAGAEILEKSERIWEQAELVVKVKEPQPEECDQLKQGQTVFCYLHLAPLPELTRALINRGVNAVAYETIQTGDGHLPCLTPMSEIAGRLAVQVGARYLMRDQGGPGILLGGVPGVPPCEVLVLGAGTAGSYAARLAASLGAQVRIMDVNLRRLAYIDEVFEGRIITVMSNEHNLERYVPGAHLMVGAVLVPGARSPLLVSEDLVKKMRKGSVIVDISVDQGGCIATTRPTTHDDPIYDAHGVIHYCVTNMPGAVPRTSTQALTNATLPYVIKIAKRGLEAAAREDPALRLGINVYTPPGGEKGLLICAAVAEAVSEPCVPFEEAFPG